MMRFLWIFIFALAATASHAQPINHQLHVVLHPQEHTLQADDQITVPRGSPRTLYFSLHQDLNPTSIDADIELVGKQPESWMRRYSVTPRKGRDIFTIQYAGAIFHPPRQEGQETRNFETTPGVISEDGVVLNGESGWYPHVEVDQVDSMVTFSLEIEQPPYWQAISQGARISARGANTVWRERQPQSEIHLVAGLLKEFTRRAAKEVVYLRSNDEVLAQRYLTAATRYIAMYEKLIGTYPYEKFALVENFWETGYAMPSFSLIGSQVLRLPFIIDTSYPHEILHNWWGNGVFVDYSKGNWSEGLTAYLSDHLLQEQRGMGAEYRRSTLQKYANFVSAGKDFPLTQFTSRFSPASEAVGYGKTMMMLHMLRRDIGDDRFILALQNFYTNQKFKKASFTELEQAFSQAVNKDLKPFFEQWTQRIGAPQLRLVSAQAGGSGGSYDLSISLEQTQPGDAFVLNVPVAVTLSGSTDAYVAVVNMKDKRATFHIPLQAQPVRVDVDPEFDLFRSLGEDEAPVTFSKVMGAEKSIIVLPRRAPEELRAQYLDAANTVQRSSRNALIKWDDEIDQLPVGTATWLLGWENRFREEFQSTLNQQEGALSITGAELDHAKFARESSVLAIASRVNKTPVIWFAVPDAQQLPMFMKKFPHYAKFSYAAFAKTEVPSVVPEKKKSWLDFPSPPSQSSVTVELINLAKGTWGVGQSPLAMPVQQADGSVTNAARGGLARRYPLVR